MMSGLPEKKAPDAPGEFRFAGLSPGEVLVTVRAQGLHDREMKVVLVEGETTTETGTDEEGRFEIRIPSGPCRILFIRDEVIRVLAELDLAEGSAREVALTLAGE